MNLNIPQFLIQNTKRMNKDDFFKNLNGHKFLEGKPEQVTEAGQVLKVRKDWRGYYITWKESKEIVAGTEAFVEWMDARTFMMNNWKRLLDEEFERQVLIGSKGSETDDNPEDPSST